MPCPSGVNIPRNFSVYNDYYMFGEEQQSSAIYEMKLMSGFTGKRTDASLCKECKQCLERCPQHIAIPELLKSMSKDLGGAKTRSNACHNEKRSTSSLMPVPKPKSDESDGLTVEMSTQ
jgi:predicted aldo/keto reductase-like oxidoreductase